MTLTKEKDFVQIDFVGRVKDSNQIFDLTSEELAKKEGLVNQNNHHHFGPKIICLGLNQILPPIDEFLIDKEINKSYTLELSPEKAFGKKNLSLRKIISIDILRKQNINPFPGLKINASGLLGTIISVSGGRVTVDFNHPLAGKNIVYELTLHKIVNDDKDKISSLVESLIGLHDHDFNIKLESNKAHIDSNTKLPNDLKDAFIKKVKGVLPNIDVSFN